MVMFINASTQKNQSKRVAIASKNEHSPLSCVCVRVVCCVLALSSDLLYQVLVPGAVLLF